MNTSFAFFPAILLLLIACQTPEKKSTPPVQEKAITTSEKDTNSIILSADTLRPTGSLSLSFLGNHPAKMAIIIPGSDNPYVFLQDGSEISEIFPADSFAKVRIMVLKADQQGIRFINGSKHREAIFKKSGYYTVVLADNLETEPENTNSIQARVYFSSGRKD